MRTRAIIHLDRFLENIHVIKDRIGPRRRVCAAVKADAYGHGALQMAKISVQAGVFCLAVATVGEGRELRDGGITIPILLLSQPHPQDIRAVFDAVLTPFVSDSEFAAALNEQAAAAKTRLPVHLKIDTGMGRIGCPAAEAPALAAFIKACAGLELAGTATHLAVSESAESRDIAYTQAQLARFKGAVDAIRTAGIDPGIVHAANSGAIILHPDSWLDMVRPGILLYGYKLAEEADVPGFPFDPLRIAPVMELRSTVVLIRKVKKGESVSYGRTWAAAEDTNIAVLPAGYADGFPRSASNRWQVLINGRMYPQVGRICMDQCLVDVGNNTDVRRWDEAVIFGGSAPSAALLAQAVGTIPYEITCGINKRVSREYTQSGTVAFNAETL